MVASMKIIKKTAVILLVVLIAMQFYRPEKNTAQGDHTVIFITETNPPKMLNLFLKTPVTIVIVTIQSTLGTII